MSQFLIDIHAHVGRRRDRDDEIAMLRGHLDRCGLQRALVSNLSARVTGDNADEVIANCELLELVRRDTRLVPLYWVRPGRFDANPKTFRGALIEEPFAGAVFDPVDGGYQIGDYGLLDPYLAICEQQQAPVFVVTTRDEAAAPARLYGLARRNPAVAFVLYDAFRDVHFTEALDVVRRASERRDARLYLDTGGLGPAEIAEAIACVGADYVLYGSSATNGDDDGDLTGQQECLKTLRQSLPSSSCRKLCGDNALRLFRFLAPTPA